jgi:hypothetical protein
MSTEAKTPTLTPIPAKNEPAKQKSLEDLILEQGVAQTATFEHLLGRGAELWADDVEFEAFLASLQAIRREKD